MKIMKVIHGYPMRYNAGSEVYSQTLCHGLAAQGHQVHVFTREENSFATDFSLRHEQDPDDPRILLQLVNNPRLKDRYRAAEIDQKFAQALTSIRPDIVHIGHLNHLSTSLVQEAAYREIPIVFTLHDYWLMCPRGQFMQMFPEDTQQIWTACDGQEDKKCAERCYARYFSGDAQEYEHDVAYWSDWVNRRMKHVRQMAEMVDLFIAPAQYLYQRFHRDFGIPKSKMVYLDYGFDRSRMHGRVRGTKPIDPKEPFVFGYIGTHIPAKGIHDLIRAFGLLRGNTRLRIWGRHRGQDSDALQQIAASFPNEIANRIEWMPEYKNQRLVQDVFEHCDAIVVPSIWVENSPLVIHEAQQARVPVITADVGGMAEYVHHRVNGLLFQHRHAAALAEQMQCFVDDPVLARRLGQRGYLNDANGDIPDIQEHVREIEKLYHRVLHRQQATHIQTTDTPNIPNTPNILNTPNTPNEKDTQGPWRITFDTNPDTCNLRCVMCEEHSPHSLLQIQRKAEGRPRRLMPFDWIERVVAEAAPHGLREIIPSTMGEPLLYDDFEKILDLCHQYRIRLNLTTNGTFPRLGAAVWAEKIVPVASDIKISWNGATKETHEKIMLGSRWEIAVENLQTLIRVRDQYAGGQNEGTTTIKTKEESHKNRCRITLQLTFLEDNFTELPEIVRLAIGWGVDRIKGHHLWAHFAEIQEQSMRRSSEAIQRWNDIVRTTQHIAATHPLPNGKHILLENIFELDAERAVEDIAPEGPCPFLGKEAWISAQGRFDPCCAPDAQRRTLGEFGNVQQNSFMEIWRNPAYKNLLATYRNRHLCVSCNMRK